MRAPDFTISTFASLRTIFGVFRTKFACEDAPNILGVARSIIETLRWGGLPHIITLVLISAAVTPARAEYKLRQYVLPNPVSDLFVADGGRQTLALLRNGGMAKLVLDEFGAKLVATNFKKGNAANLPGQLPGSQVALSALNIAAAWLINPTRRYGHGVLGDAIEAGGLAVDTVDGRSHKFYLPNDSVLEDLQPRIVDLDGDGRAEVISIRSYIDSGAALAIFGLKQNKLTILAETPPIGHSNRWLNPVGVGDIDGDGTKEIVYIETPHIGGTLHAYRFSRGKLAKVYETRGFSNHKIGSRVLGLSIIADLNKDGIEELLIPDQSRNNIRVLDFAKGRHRQLGQVKLPSEISSNMRVSRLRDKLQVLFLLSATRLAQITF